jgi:hypothetical protein
MRIAFATKHSRGMWLCGAFFAAAIFLAPITRAQNSPQVNTVDPAEGKVNDTVTLTGSSLDKATVSAVYLSDDKNDYKAAISEQSGEKIVIKIPQVKSGSYNITVQVGDKLFIKPVKFKVAE